MKSILSRWNYNTQAYELFQAPEEWNVPLLCLEMDTVVNCANCGIKMQYGDGFTSKEIHDPWGLGYAVCHECYDKEIEREREYRQTERSGKYELR